ncbi:MAG: EAL domain-containing protein [Microvirga sp.]
MEDRIRLIRDVREGVARDQFVPFYQPKVSLATGRINGLEALARWHHPIRGILSPAVFGAAFDDHELAIELGKQLLAKVVSDMREWLGAGREIGRVAFNLSSAECSQADLASRILTLLGARGVPTRHFEVEVTETVLLGSDTCSIKANLERLHDAGVQVALDDFGTGFASLTHLKQFPVDHIKIDRSFISDLDGNSHSEAIVAAVAGLAKSLEMMVTAEGVETSGQMARLRDLGCGFAQGNLFSYPVPASEAVCLFGKTLVPAAG